MRVPSVSISLAALLAASLGQAQYLINELSFGYSGRCVTLIHASLAVRRS